MRWLQQRREEGQAAATVAQRMDEDLPDMELETCAIMAVREAGPAQPDAQAAEASGTGAEQAQPEGHGRAPAPASAAARGAEEASAGAEPAAGSAAFGSPVAGRELSSAQPGDAVAEDPEVHGDQPPVSAEQADSPAAQAGSGHIPLQSAAHQLAARPTPAEQPLDAGGAPAAGLDQSAELAALAPAFAGQADQAGPGAEPTMTLSTRDAFAAINQMFGVRPGALYGVPGSGHNTAHQVRVALPARAPCCVTCAVGVRPENGHPCFAAPSCALPCRAPSPPTLPSTSPPPARLPGAAATLGAAAGTNPP